MDTIILFIAEYLHIFIVSIFVIFFCVTTYTTRKELFFQSMGTFLLAFSLSRLLSVIISSPRPFVVENITPLFPHTADNGFPSDHTLLTATIAAIVFAYNKKLGVWFFALSLLVGGARILAKVHHLADIAGSIGIAVFSAWIICILCDRLTKKINLPTT